MAIAPTKVIEYKEEEDPKEAVLNALSGKFKDWIIQGNQVLISNKPTLGRSKGGILFTDRHKEEDTRFQSTIGLVVGHGPLAFEDEGRWPRASFRPKVGSWVQFRASDGDRFAVDDYECRFLRDDLILAVVPGPEGIR